MPVYLPWLNAGGHELLPFFGFNIDLYFYRISNLILTLLQRLGPAYFKKINRFVILNFNGLGNVILPTRRRGRQDWQGLQGLGLAE